MTLYISLAMGHSGCKEGLRPIYHFKRPHSPNPHLQLARDSFNVLELNALPPASTSGLSPEQKQLLRHANSVAVGCRITANVRAQARERDRTYDCLVGLGGTVTPSVCTIKATGKGC